MGKLRALFSPQPRGYIASENVHREGGEGLLCQRGGSFFVKIMISFFLTASTKPFAVSIPGFCNVSLWGHRGVVTMDHVTPEYQGQ